jgi:hypothetical protein
MNAMIAEAGLANESMQIGVWLIAGTAVLQAANAAIGVARFFTNRSERRQVTISPGLVSRPEFETHVNEDRHEHEKLFARLGGMERGLHEQFNNELKAAREEGLADIRALHQEINEVARKVSGLEATNTIQSQRLAEISAKLDRVIERQKKSRGE